MKKLNSIKNFVLKYWLYIAVFIILTIITITVIIPSLSAPATSSIWDGTISTSFHSGSGTANDPYEINTGSELAYFFDVMDDEDYFNRSYKLTNNIDLNGRDFSNIDTTEYFSGTLNGNGYYIYNFTINSFKNDPNLSYSLFGNLINANICNLNISNITFNTSHNDSVVALIGTANGSNISNISLNNIVVNSTGNNQNISGLIGIDTGLNNFNLINIDFRSNRNAHVFTDRTSNTVWTNNSSFNNILVKDNGINTVSDNNFLNITNVYNYRVVNNNINVTNGNINDILNTYSNTNYVWHIEDGIINLEKNNNVIVTIPDAHETGVDGSTVYINDYQSDYDYYIGLNFTDSSDLRLPTNVSKNIYSDNNLVYVELNYKSEDYPSAITLINPHVGYISPTENQNQIVYYKVYPVNNNNTPNNSNDDYVEFELIDNPWSVRPDDCGFNGWVADSNVARISLDLERYVRTIKIPITYQNGKPNPINLDLYSSWTDATTYTLTSNAWSTAINNMLSAGMTRALYQPGNYYDLDGLYYETTISRNERYLDGDLYKSGNRWYDASGRTCSSNNCDVRRPATGTEYSSSRTYYTATLTSNWLNGDYYTLTRTTPTYIEKGYYAGAIGNVAAGFFRKVTLPNRTNPSGYYDASGNLISTNTTCNSNCVYYEYINLYDENGNVELMRSGVEYYYLVTRDTNIIFLGRAFSGVWSSQTKPFTFTGVNNGTNNSGIRWTVSSSALTAGADVRIEMMQIYSSTRQQSNDTAPSTSGSRLYGNYHNVKLGRGITQNSTYTNFGIAGGGYTSFSGSTVKRYTFIVESGLYNNLGLATLSTINNSVYVNAYGIFGSDIDRAKGDNSKLTVRYCLSGSWAGNIYSNSTSTVGFHTYIKSGSFGTNQYDYAAGVYIGGRGGGGINFVREGIIEGGYIVNLIGGPLTPENVFKSGNTILNDTYIYVKGGSVDILVGGAGASETYGNKISSVTGGTINYSIFGGSNGIAGSEGSDYTGILKGDTYVYVGGHAVIGSESAMSAFNSRSTLNSISKVEPGSVFGAGNGNSSSISVGSVNNSNVIIDGDAIINNNVYGGGNYGATGYSNVSPYLTSTTNVTIYGGNIKGSVYGAGNNNGGGNYAHSGYNNVTNNVNITIDGGNFSNGIYGGANNTGTVYGSTNLNILKGNIIDVYGGGRGNATYITGNVDITLGNDEKMPDIAGAVYGGSSLGTVNSNNANASYDSTKHVNVIVNNARVTGSIFGGGKGASNTVPHTIGAIKVEINNGSIGSVYGAFDQNGTTIGPAEVYLKGGVIGSVYGGGNHTGAGVTNVYEQGATVTNLFGGSNSSGNVTETNVNMSHGNVNYLYGGNNLGGTVNETNVTVSDGNIRYEVYGGGNIASVWTTNVLMNGGVAGSIFGGGHSANATTTNVTIACNATNVYGGSNQSGVVNNSNVIVNNANVTNVYGGNNSGGNCVNTHVTVNGGNTTNMYGGGNEAAATDTEVSLNTGTVLNMYGGGNQAGTSNTTVNVNGGDVTNLYGGGYNGNVNNETNITINKGNIDSVFGAGNNAGARKTNISILSGSITNIYGGANQTGNVTNSNISTSQSSGVANDIVYNISYQVLPAEWRSTTYKNYVPMTISITNNTNRTITNFDGYFYLQDSVIFSNYTGTEVIGKNNVYSFNEENIYHGTNTIAPNGTYSFQIEMLTNIDSSNFNLSKSIIASDGINNYSSGSSTFVGDVYGGNNRGGVTTNTNIILDGGTFGNVYGGGNQAMVNSTNVEFKDGLANNLYSGGNQAMVNGNTQLTITGGEIVYNGYGGGNEGVVSGDTNVNMNGGHIDGRIFAGGNGTTAVVNGDSSITISGDSVIGSTNCSELKMCSVFASGNAAATGTENDQNSVATVNVAGGTIYGNVYGGGNTSTVYGSTITNIGANVPTSANVTRSDILIGGTVFGGGEANAEGDAIFDYTAKSVIGSITININGESYSQLDILGSIFGSGNASSSLGTSTININKFGNRNHIEKCFSIQRADKVTISQSFLQLTGATDSENNYSDRQFSLSKIKKLYLKDNTSLFLENNALMLENFYSVDADNRIETIDIQENSITRNVNNRLYLKEGINFNISKDQNNQDYGNVYGMTFLGMYNYRNNNVNIGIYDDYDQAELVGWNNLFDTGSYVQAIHQDDYNTNGFYSNFIEGEDGYNNIQIIVPQPPNADYHEWIIGSAVRSYEIDLEASKYSTLGVVELPFNEYYQANTTFVVLGFDYSELADEIVIKDESQIPKVANSWWEADRYFGLAMKSSVSGWLNNGETSFLSQQTNNVVGTKTYIGDASTSTPSLLFYLYHSKNITNEGDMGSVTINMLVINKVDALTNNTERITIKINLSRVLFGTNAYEGAITAGRQYELFSTSNVNITNKSAFSAYFSLFVTDSNPYQLDYKRAIVTNSVLPEGTKLTMIDLSGSQKKYYYYVITSADVSRAADEIRRTGDTSYYLSKFYTMGATSSSTFFNDRTINQSYNTSQNYAEEEFIFIVDFEDTNIEEDFLNNSFQFELQNNQGRTVINVLGIQATNLKYNVYAEDDATIEVTAKPDRRRIYTGDTITINSKFNVIEAKVGASTVYDTKTFESKMGVELSLINSDGEIVTGTSLLGLYYEIDDVKYYPNIDGTTRIKLTERVGSYENWIRLCTENVVLATGQYKLRFKTFASPDGIYYGRTGYSVFDLDLYLISEIYGLKATTDDNNLVIDQITGHNNKDESTVLYNLEYSSGLTDPSIRVKLYRRDYNNEYTTLYHEVDLKDYVNDELTETDVLNEYQLIRNPGHNSEVTFNFKENLVTGTYKLEFILYDDDSSIGSIEKYFIIK